MQFGNHILGLYNFLQCIPLTFKVGPSIFCKASTTDVQQFRFMIKSQHLIFVSSARPQELWIDFVLCRGLQQTLNKVICHGHQPGFEIPEERSIMWHSICLMRSTKNNVAVLVWSCCQTLSRQGHCLTVKLGNEERCHKTDFNLIKL